MLQRKICMLGSFGVGKTSLVQRFVSSIFSENYQTTIGVRIDRKTVLVKDQEVRIMLWDLHGDDELQRVRASYLRGMAAYLLVVDGTRPESLQVATSLHQLVLDSEGELPFLLLLNKSDLHDEWALDESQLESLRDRAWDIRHTSAKSGLNVEESFHDLAARTLHSK